MEKVSFEIDAKLDKATKAVEDLTAEIENLRKEQEDLAKGQNTLGSKMKKGFAVIKFFTTIFFPTKAPAIR